MSGKNQPRHPDGSFIKIPDMPDNPPPPPMRPSPLPDQAEIFEIILTKKRLEEDGLPITPPVKGDEIRIESSLGNPCFFMLRAKITAVQDHTFYGKDGPEKCWKVRGYCYE